MRWTVTVDYLTAAGVLRQHRETVEAPDPQTAERIVVRGVLRQSGREIVGIETDRA